MENFFSETYSIENYENWDHRIFEAAENFRAKSGIWPCILLANSETIDALGLFMSRKLMAEGKIEAPTEIGLFCCSHFQLEICLDSELEDHTFALIYDDGAEFLDEEPPEANELPAQK